MNAEPVLYDYRHWPHLLISAAEEGKLSSFFDTLFQSLTSNECREKPRFAFIDLSGRLFDDLRSLPQIRSVAKDLAETKETFLWIREEIARRYSLMEQIDVRNLRQYNEVMTHDPEEDRIPCILLVVDELAVLMHASEKGEFEDHICHIASLGYGAGVHMALATADPYHDILTARLRASIPSAIAL